MAQRRRKMHEVLIDMEIAELNSQATKEASISRRRLQRQLNAKRRISDNQKTVDDINRRWQNGMRYLY